MDRLYTAIPNGPTHKEYITTSGLPHAVPTVFIPPQLRALTGGLSQTDVEGRTVRELIDRLEERFSGVRQRLCEGDELKPSLSVTVDGDISSRGLLHRLQPDSEVHFLPAIGGG